jgi:hypothetical protein
MLISKCQIERSLTPIHTSRKVVPIMTLKNPSQSNLGLDACFQNWLVSQSDNDLRQVMSEDVGEMIRDRAVAEIERRGVGAIAVLLGKKS